MSQATPTFINSTAPYKNLNASCKHLFELKATKECSFADIAAAIGRDEVWTAALFYGQATATEDDIKALAKFFEVEASLIAPLANVGGVNINRGDLGPMPPTDPVIYRLYEGIMVYGYPIKAIIHEKFGDGIMSLIDCRVHVNKKEDPKGDRVLLTFDGKFLPYIKW
ncbi:Cyanate hydratase [Tulasnella sp. JGI-2019a]|nr:Cyanate hydratase [Tulasnella sp. JGI-2019a]KAG9033348.1 Cyanate hydratase [Tulasnella sp. JGI-2019a]